MELPIQAIPEEEKFSPNVRRLSQMGSPAKQINVLIGVYFEQQIDKFLQSVFQRY